MKREDEISNAAMHYAYDIDKVFATASFVAGAEWADAHPLWISVIDETPPQNEAYLAYWQHLGVTKYRYVKAGAKVSRTFSEHVTHWMPLPEAPKKGGKK